MTHWVSVPSVGCFGYFARDPAETPALCRALLATIIEELGVAERDLNMVARNVGKWRKFSWKVVDEAIADPERRSILLMVGTPQKVHLGAEVNLRRDRRWDRPDEPGAPAGAWLVAETQRWPRALLLGVCRRWLELAAQHGEPLSGGVLAATDLRNAKMEASLFHERDDGEVSSPADYLFRQRLTGDWHEGTWKQLRRLYPVTLLGRPFATRVSADELRAAGAVRVEAIGDSLLVDTYPEVVPAWSPAFLAATLAQRRLVWPLTQQKPADAEGLGLKLRFEPTISHGNSVALGVPEDKAAFLKLVQAELKRERLELERLAAR